MRVLAVALFMIAAAGCGSDTSDPTTAAPATSTATTEPAADPLVGEWKRTNTCRQLATALKQAGLGDATRELVAGEGFVDGSSTTDVCANAVDRDHSHFFTPEGQFGSKDAEGDIVDDGTYTITDPGTVIIHKEFGDITFHYTVTGDTITFDPVIPDTECSTDECAFSKLWSVMVAYPGLTWQRVG
jgi:hypothetical protein